jgi:hypothetical protein
MREDFIMRLIEQAAAMLAAIIAKRNAGDFPAAEEKINLSCQQRIGVPLELIRHATPEALTQFLSRDGQLRYVDAVLVGELMMQEAEICDATGKAPEALRSREQAFCLLTDAMPVLPLDDATVYRAKLEGLLEKIRDDTADPYVIQKMSDLKEALAEKNA